MNFDQQTVPLVNYGLWSDLLLLHAMDVSLTGLDFKQLLVGCVILLGRQIKLLLWFLHDHARQLEKVGLVLSKRRTRHKLLL